MTDKPQTGGLDAAAIRARYEAERARRLTGLGTDQFKFAESEHARMYAASVKLMKTLFRRQQARDRNAPAFDPLPGAMGVKIARISCPTIPEPLPGRNT